MNTEKIFQYVLQPTVLAMAIWSAGLLSRKLSETPRKRSGLRTLLVALLLISGYSLSRTDLHREGLAQHIVWLVFYAALVASAYLLGLLYLRPRVLGEARSVQDELVIELQMILNRRFGDRYRVVDRTAGADLELTVATRDDEQPVAPALTIPFETLDEATHTLPFDELITDVEAHFAASGGKGDLR